MCAGSVENDNYCNTVTEMTILFASKVPVKLLNVLKHLHDLAEKKWQTRLLPSALRLGGNSNAPLATCSHISYCFYILLQLLQTVPCSGYR